MKIWLPKKIDEITKIPLRHCLTEKWMVFLKEVYKFLISIFIYKIALIQHTDLIIFLKMI